MDKLLFERIDELEVRIKQLEVQIQNMEYARKVHNDAKVQYLQEQLEKYKPKPRFDYDRKMYDTEADTWYQFVRNGYKSK